MIEVFKITHDIYDSDMSPKLAYHSGSMTRGNKYKLFNHGYHYDLRKHYFSARIVNIWTSLPNHVVDVIMLALSTCSRHAQTREPRCEIRFHGRRNQNRR